MKKLKSILSVFILLTLIFAGCKETEDIKPEENIIPENFKVEIPKSLSQTSKKHTKSGKELQGNDIYEHLTTFINVGQGAADIVQDIMVAIGEYNLNQAMSFSYTSDEDGRVKNVLIIENSTFEGTVWSYQLTITDAESEGNEDGGKAMQVFWNSQPVVGISVLKPYNINRNDNDVEQAMFRIDYSEAGENNYEKQMTVYIADLPLEDPLTDPYSMSTLKMFVGKNGDVIDVLGNSNHPNATFFTSDAGFNWAFVAAADRVQDIGVAEVGLPQSGLDTDDRNIILVENSIKNVFTEQIYNTWPNIDSLTVANYLHNTGAPGYFNNGGFIAGGESPGSQYDVIENSMNALSPYNPLQITNLQIEFKND